MQRAVDSELVGSEKGRSLISAYRSLAIATNTPGLKKLSMALKWIECWVTMSAAVCLVHVLFPLATYMKEILSRLTNTNVGEIIMPV